ncbi:hypothetical protein MRB53_017464 [Persea americana]|uniref:Uncharacterized protein n=1 Tax=Persea americana TaxID=3435 RepID=A0ACC2M573_PERAE|nr:hypothetical protein MRB53_017464 [Persea americana]
MEKSKESNPKSMVAVAAANGAQDSSLSNPSSTAPSPSIKIFAARLTPTNPSPPSQIPRNPNPTPPPPCGLRQRSDSPTSTSSPPSATPSAHLPRWLRRPVKKLNDGGDNILVVTSLHSIRRN